MWIWLILICVCFFVISMIIYRKKEQERKQKILLHHYQRAIRCNKSPSEQINQNKSMNSDYCSKYEQKSTHTL